MSQVLISEELFMNLYKFFNIDNPDMELYNKCKRDINIKAEKINNRNLYTKYKQGQTKQVREQARQAYLDNKNISSDWRW